MPPAPMPRDEPARLEAAPARGGDSPAPPMDDTAARAGFTATMETMAQDGLDALLCRLRDEGSPGSTVLSAALKLRRPAPTRSTADRLDIAARLREILVPGPASHIPFTLAFQPVLALDNSPEASLEALVRWEVKPGRFIPPSDFVPVAERLGLVPHLDRWVMRRACAAAAAWPEAWSVSVNVSAATFGLIDVSAMVRSALLASKLPPYRLVVEMTETALAGDPALAHRSIEALKLMGIRVALDDFGAGYNCLASLGRLPFSELKIDRGLTERVTHDKVQAHLVALVAELGRSMGVNVAAEGVETEDDLRTVSRLGCTRAQGYWLSRPVADRDVPDAVARAMAAIRNSLGGVATPLPC